MAIFYIDPADGDDVNSGADWANAWETITNGATSGRLSPGDEVRIRKSDGTDWYQTTAAGTADEVVATTTVANVSYIGGYDTTTNTITGVTRFDGQNNLGFGFLVNNHGCTIKNLEFKDYYQALRILTNNNVFDVIAASSCGNHAVWFERAHHNILNSITTDNNSGYALVLYGSSSNNIIRNFSSTSDVKGLYNGLGVNYCKNVTITTPTGGDAIARDGKTDMLMYANGRLNIENYQTTGEHLIHTDGGTISSDTTNRHTASGICWKMAVTSVSRASDYPLDLKIASVACEANKQVTAKVWVKKSHATDIAAKLVCRGGQIAGVASDVTDTKADDTDYEELSVVFTPTAAGVVNLEVWAYWAANTADEFVYVDDFSVTQAT